MKNSEYWQERFKQLEEAQNRLAQTSFKEIESQYRAAIKEFEGKINTWYQRLAKNNGVSMAEARKLLNANELEEFKWSVWDYIKHGEENSLNGQWIKQLENASAKFHISKYQALMIDTQQTFEKMFGQQLNTVTETMGKVFENGYYKTTYELQKGFNTGFNVGKINAEEVEKVLFKPWAVDGKNFSERIWGNKDKLINEVHTQLTQNIITGADPQKAIDAIAKKMNTSKSNAGRLVMTEEAYFSSVAQGKSYVDMGVEKYEVLATLDSLTSEICQNLDGKVFDMKDYKPGVTANPFHVNCRSTTVPHLDEEFWGTGDGKRAARGEDGKTYYIPDDITYPEWKKGFVEGDKSGFKGREEQESKERGQALVKNFWNETSDGDKKNVDKSGGSGIINVEDELMKKLPCLSEVRTNDDIKAFAEQFIDNLGIDCTNISVSIQSAIDFGHCTVGSETTQKIIHYNQYVLNANDKRSITHRIKTAFHESFHLSAEGREWDGLTAAYEIKEPWRNLEETFAEASAHYLLERYGVAEKIAPSYAKELVTNLPRLKRLDKYLACDTIQDFGKIAFSDRYSGADSMWIKLSKQMKQIKLADDYYTQYYSYINDHEEELFDMFLANNPGLDSYRELMKESLNSAMKKNRLLMTDDEQEVYYGILSCAMQKVGVK